MRQNDPVERPTKRFAMTNVIQDSRLLYFKGTIFLLLGILSTVLIILQVPDWKLILLHLIAIWAFSRACYFAFYVVQHYVDPSFRFSGLWDFARYVLASNGVRPKQNAPEHRKD